LAAPRLAERSALTAFAAMDGALATVGGEACKHRGLFVREVGVKRARTA